MLRCRNALIKDRDPLLVYTPARSVGRVFLARKTNSMLVLLCASADGALSAGFFQSAPTSRLRPRPVPVMAAATEEPVLRPQLMGAAALTGTATGSGGTGCPSGGILTDEGGGPAGGRRTPSGGGTLGGGGGTPPS